MPPQGSNDDPQANPQGNPQPGQEEGPGPILPPEQEPGQPVNPPQEPNPEDDLPTININELAASYQAPHGEPQEPNAPKYDESRREVKFLPCQETSVQLAGGAVMACDEHGNLLSDYDAIRKGLDKPGSRLFLFDQDGNPPHAVENRKGKLFISDSGIDANHQLPGSHFLPAGSLEIDRIVGWSAAGKLAKSREDMQKAKQRYDTEGLPLRREIRELKDQQQKLEKQQPRMRIAKRDAPTFGWGARLQRWGFKLITLGFGETDAYRKYQSDMAAYREHDKQYKEAEKKYKSDMTAFRQKKMELNNKVLDKEEELGELKSTYDNTQKYHDKQVENYRQAREKGRGKVRDYRENLEVLLEGTADMVKEGEINRRNVFANTWHKKAACDAKDPSDPEAKEAFAEYLASKMVEEKLLQQSMSGERDSTMAAEEKQLLRSLNSGEAAKQLRNSPEFEGLVQDLEDFGELIDAEAGFEDMKQRMAEKAKEQTSPTRRLQNEKKSLTETFGKKPLTEGSFEDVRRMQMLNRAINKSAKDPKFTSETAGQLVADLYRNSDKKIFYYSDIPSEEETRQALKTLSEQHKGENLSLEEMTDMVGEQVKAQKEAGRQQNGPKIG